MGFNKEELISLANHKENFIFHNPKIIKGKERDFYVPRGRLKIVLKEIDRKILDRIDMPNSFQGGIKNRSLKTNAEKHSNKQHLLKIDIKDFFPSIHPDKVFVSFKRVVIGAESAKILTSLTTINKPSPQLPQGFNTSPKIASLILLDFEKRLNKLAQKYNWNYSFWIDDIAISGNFPIKKFKNLLIKILKDEGFEVNPDKIKFVSNKERMSVSNIVVNKFPNISKEIRKEIKTKLHLIKKIGPVAYLENQGARPTNSNINKLKNKLLGNINFFIGINKKLGQELKKTFQSIDW